MKVLLAARVQRVHEAGLFKAATSALKPTHPQ
jgi:hypothetical protein